MKQTKFLSSVFLVLLAIVLIIAFFMFKADKYELDPFWLKSNEINITAIDHNEWQYLLDEYLISDDPSGINYVDYEVLLEEDSQRLVNYLNMLSSLDPRVYSNAEQMAYWINLYNALTVKLIIDNYPIESITKLGNNKFSFGPWGDPIVTIAGQALSLNDIEHRILRPIWKDYRIHFAVNCASKGCPNLQAMAFTSDNTDILLNKGALEYLQHPRGLKLEGNTLFLSSIFDWYQQDFGLNRKQLLNNLSQHLPDILAKQIQKFNGTIKYHYDWDLNEY